MSLYYEAASFIKSKPASKDTNQNTVLENLPSLRGLKFRVYNPSDHQKLKSKPANIYALLAETIKWGSVLYDVLQRSGVLDIEKRKLSPALALLLTHDLLLSKSGIAAPKDHILRKIITKHRARLGAELTRARIKAGFSTIEAWRAHIDSTAAVSSRTNSDVVSPRWVRINTLLTTLPIELRTAFAYFTPVTSLSLLADNPQSYVIDPHVLDLLAVHSSATSYLTSHESYKAGHLILQNKASCLPALLLDPRPTDGDILDACAAPGNKTSHLAALLSAHYPNSSSSDSSPHRNGQILACERDPTRWDTLKSQLSKTHAAAHVSLLPRGTDFLSLRPSDDRLTHVGAVLLDPSCSGSGIVGREDEDDDDDDDHNNGVEQEQAGPRQRGTERIARLAGVQTRLLLHAMALPAVRKVVYSTCSVHYEENEGVALAALRSGARGWRVLRREEQVEGCREWGVRGIIGVEEDGLGEEGEWEREFREACLRCEKGTEDGTMGFFAVGFVRDEEECEEAEEAEEWEGIESDF